MVNPALQSAIGAMSVDERLGLVEHIDCTVEAAPVEISDETNSMIRSRVAELDAALSVGSSYRRVLVKRFPRKADRVGEQRGEAPAVSTPAGTPARPFRSNV